MAAERPEWEPLSLEEAVARLVDAGLLTEREAEVWVQREVEGVPGFAVAEDLDISQSTMRTTLSRARKKLEQAEVTLEAVEEIRERPLPDECAECGTALGGRFFTTDDEPDRPLCTDCADVE